MSPLAGFFANLAANWQPIVISLLLVALGVLVVIRQKQKKRKGEGRLRGEGADGGDAVAYVEVLPPAPIPPTRQIRQTVRNGFRALKGRVTNRDLRYRTPFFLLLGPESSGKTTLLRQLLPEAVSPTDAGDAAGCRWHFFDRAVAIEVDGRLLICDSNPSASAQGWRSLHRALRFHRPERPIDGIVLAIPASDLVGPKRLSGDLLVTRARQLFQRLQAAQKVLGVRVPLYLTVTKCDLLAGFQEFCASLPVERREEIFGWSNPYALESAFIPSWVDQAFDSLADDLFEVQAELLSRGEATDPEALFELASSVGSMRGPLRAFLGELCRESAYQESFFFRGLYLIGDGTRDISERMLDAPYLTADLADVGGAEIRTVLPSLPATIPVSREPYFLRELFGQKIFGEAGLARAVGTSRLSRNRAILGMQIAAALIIFVGGIGLWRGRVMLERESGLLVSVLEAIETDLRYMTVRASLPDDAGPSTLENRVFPLLSSMARVNENRLASLFVPSSWVSSLHWDIAESMRQGFTNVILPSMYEALLAKADSIVSPPAPSMEDGLHLDGGELPRYLRDVAVLAANVERYDTIAFIGAENTELQNVAALVQYLFNEELPPEFIGNERYYRTALWESYGQRITPTDRPMYAEDVVTRAEYLLRDYYDALIYRLEDINLRFESAERVQRMTATDLADFRTLRTELSEVQRVLDGSQPFWFDESARIDPLLEIIDSIPSTPLTPTPVIASRFEQMFQRVRAEKLLELEYRLDPFQQDGSTLLTAGGTAASLSPRLAELQSALDTLFSQPFIAVGAPPGNRRPLAPGTRVRWDVAALDRAILEHQQFQNFLTEQQASESPGMANLIQGLATVQLEASIAEAVSRARVPAPPSYAFGQRDRERDLSARITAFIEPSRRLIQILEISEQLGMNQTYDEVAAQYVDQAVEMLAEADALLEEGGAYRPVGGSLATWDGSTPAVYPAFRARDAEELDRYLQQQRARIRFLVDNFAAPLLGGLLSDPLAPFLGSASGGAAGLVLKWGDLIGELDRYEAESGANSVAVLEQFIRDEMGTTDMSRCLAGPSQAGAGGDYFLAARNRLRSQLFARCQQIASDMAAERYERIRTFFNANLAGRYPFSRDAGSAAEADLAAIRNVFRLMDEIEPVRGAVQQPSIVAFLEGMDEVRAFLGPLASGEPIEGGPGFDVTVDFRTNRDQEYGADQIVDWTLGLGDGVLTYRGQESAATTRWTAGSPASLSLRWALQSDERPVTAGYVSAGATDRDATFAYEGRWGIIRLLQGHVTGPPTNEGYLLRFDVPTTRRVAGAGPLSGEARVFARIGLSYPGGGAVAALPVFPVQAP